MRKRPTVVADWEEEQISCASLLDRQTLAAYCRGLSSATSPLKTLGDKVWRAHKACRWATDLACSCCSIAVLHLPSPRRLSREQSTAGLEQLLAGSAKGEKTLLCQAQP